MITIGVVQSRLASSRLPEKALAMIGGEPMVLRVLRRLGGASGLDVTGLATSDDASDDALAAMVGEMGFRVSRGPVDDIVLRLRRACEEAEADVLVRVWGDCPFLTPDAVDAVLAPVREGASFAGTNPPGTPRPWPAGFGVEAYSRDLLRCLDDTLPSGGPLREFPVDALAQIGITPVAAPAPPGAEDVTAYLCVDYPEDLEAARRLAAAEAEACGPHGYRAASSVFALLKARPDLAGAFSDRPRNVEYEAFKERN